MDHDSSPEPDRSPSVDELLAEYHRRVDAGEAVDREQFLRRHPESADALRSYFEGTDLVERLASPRGQASPELPAVQSLRSAETIAPRGLSDSGEIATGPFASLPAQFGRYRVEKLLGSGAMGSVYLAQDTQLDRPVALKMPRLSGQEGTDVIHRLQREAKAAANLNHPNVCRVYDVGIEAGTYFIAMEYIDGRPLSEYVVPGHFHDERRCANVVRKMALALAEAHAKGIIHRDLKPANILINLRGEPVLTDFGLARILDTPQDGRATRSGMIIGSPAYMSPEQANGETDKICPASDIYSLGVLFFELLTSQLPFQGSVLTILSQIATKEPPLPSSLRPGLDPRLDVICCRMLAKKIADRYGAMTDVARELETWLTSSPIARGPDPQVRTSSNRIMSPHVSSGPRGPDHGAEPTKDSIGGLLPVSPKVAAAKKSDAPTPDDILRQKQRAQKLFGEHNYDTAIQILTKLVALKGTLFQEAVTWAKTTLPAAKEKQQNLRDQSAKACEKARALLAKLDYAGAAQTLESIPAGARSEEVRQLLSQANEKYEECLGLQQEIEEAVNRRKYDRLLPLVKRYLKLKPDSPKMERLAEHLERNRPDRAVANYKGRSRYFDVAGRLIEPKEVALSAIALLALFVVVTYGLQSYLANSKPSGNLATPKDHLKDSMNSGDTVTASQGEFRVGPVEAKPEEPALGQPAVKDENVLLDVDFTKSDGGFNLADQQHVRTNHKDGELQYVGKQTGGWFDWLHPSFGAGNKLENFIFEAEVRMPDQKKGRLGLTFGWTDPFLLRLYLDHDGRLLLSNSVPEELLPWTRSPVMRPITEFNSIRLEVADKTIRVSVNGEVLVEKRENRYQPSNLMLWLEPDEVPFDVRFRRMRLSRLPPGAKLEPLASKQPERWPMADATANDRWLDLSVPGSNLAAWDELESMPDPKNALVFPTHRPTTGQWTAEAGVLRCVKQAPGWLKSKREYQDFVLELEFKLPTTRNGNSGIFIRTPATGHSSNVGMEVQILDDKQDKKARPSEITGAIHRAAAASEFASKPAGQWNSMRIECRGDDITVTVNDRQVVQTNMQTNPELRTRPRKGFIGISNWKGEALGCEFRNIRIRELANNAATTTTRKLSRQEALAALRLTLVGGGTASLHNVVSVWRNQSSVPIELDNDGLKEGGITPNMSIFQALQPASVATRIGEFLDKMPALRLVWDDTVGQLVFTTDSGLRDRGPAISKSELLGSQPNRTGEGPAYDGWANVFNGKDLTGWTPMLTSGAMNDIQRSTTGGWKVENGELVCDTDQHGWLRLDRKYSNFSLNFQFFLPLDSNSGVLIRVPDQGKLGPEIQLEDDPTQQRPDQATGALYGLVAPNPDTFRSGQWNQMTINCAGDRLAIHLNGRYVVQTQFTAHPTLANVSGEGFIGLSNWRGRAKGCRFRGIKIKELADANAPVVSAVEAAPFASKPPTEVQPFPPPPARKLESEFTWLFNGNDLNGWEPQPGRPAFGPEAVKDKVLKLNAIGLQSKRKYRYFELRFDLRARREDACTMQMNWANTVTVQQGEIRFAIKPQDCNLQGSAKLREADWNSVSIVFKPRTNRPGMTATAVKVNGASIAFSGEVKDATFTGGAVIGDASRTDGYWFDNTSGESFDLIIRARGQVLLPPPLPIQFAADLGTVEISNVRIKPIQ